MMFLYKFIEKRRELRQFKQTLKIDRTPPAKLLERYKDILEKDKNGKPIFALTRKAQVTALNIGVKNDNLAIYILPHMTKETKHSLSQHIIHGFVYALMPTAFIAIGKIMGLSENRGFENLISWYGLAASLLVSMEITVYFKARSTFIKCLRRTGPLIEANIDSTKELQLSDEARKELERCGLPTTFE